MRGMGFALTALAALCAGTGLAAPQPTRIEIVSSWTGVAQYAKSGLVIRESAGIWRLNGKPVDGRAADALVTALRAPVLPEPTPQALGIDQAWLDSHAAKTEPWLHTTAIGAAENQKALFRKSFTDMGIAGPALRGLFHEIRNDNLPYAAVTITFADGSQLRAESDAPHPLMLPWHLQSAHGPETYNPTISRAVAALMPHDAVDLNWLARTQLESLLPDAVMRAILDQWNTLDAQNRAGPAFTALRARFRIDTAEIDRYHHVEYGTKWRDDLPYAESERRAEENLHVTLHRADDPPNLTEFLVLLYRKDRAENVDGFLRAEDGVHARILALPWLKRAIAENPKQDFHLSYVHDSSLGDKAMQTFADDMRAIGRGRLVSLLEPVRGQATLLMTGNEYSASYWIVLPDHRTILWRYDGPHNLLDWTVKDVTTKDCAAYQEVAGGCVGALISPGGVLTK